MKTRIIRTDTFTGDAAAIIHANALDAIGARGIFRLCLCGGTTPRPVYAELAKAYFNLPWDKTQITFGDERCVPPGDDQSNAGGFRDARASL